MKKLAITVAVISALSLTACSNDHADSKNKEESQVKQDQQSHTDGVAQNETTESLAAPYNPFFEEWTTPYSMPPFEQIKDEHFEPAFEK